MIHRHFRKTVSEILEFFDHLKTNSACGAFQGDFLEYFTADQPEITIHIPKFKTKRDFDNVVVQTSNHHPDPGVMPRDLVPIDYVHIFADGFRQIDQLHWVILSVAIGIEDPILSGIGKPRPQRAAVPLIRGMMNHFQLRVSRGKLFEDRRGVVGAAIVGNNNFVIIRHLSQSQ